MGGFAMFDDLLIINRLRSALAFFLFALGAAPVKGRVPIAE